MALYIEAKAKFKKMMENGKIKRVCEPYLVDALSCTEAEARVTKEVAPFAGESLSVEAVKKTNIAEIFRDGKSDYWYLVKINIIVLDEKSNEEKTTPMVYLVQAFDFQNALDNFLKGMKGSMSDFDITSISETKIVDVFDAD